MYQVIEEIRPVHKLALGLVPIDAIRGNRLIRPIHVEVDGALPQLLRGARAGRRHGLPLRSSWPVVSRHASGLYALLAQPALAHLALGKTVSLRMHEPDRFYVPRRMRVPLPKDPADAAINWITPVLLPGAAYDISERATGLRGRVLRNKQPMRWARIEAVLAGDHPRTVVGRAHGDDRGEFLLLLSSQASPFGELQGRTLDIDVLVYGPANPPRPDHPELPMLDPLWDLPVEHVDGDATAHAVSAAETLPPGYELLARQYITFPVGRISSHQNIDIQ